MAAGTFNPYGSAINDKSIKAITDRENILKKSNKDRNDLKQIATSTAWVKLTSSVNVLTDTEISTVEGFRKQRSYNGSKMPSGTSDKAREYILFGGTLATDGKSRRAGIESRDMASSSPAYSKYDSTGFRPMPGITNVSVKSKGQGGVLLKATVDFKVHSVEQLEDVEKLYFRPGYTALLEFGHTVFWKDKNPFKASSGTPLDTESFLKTLGPTAIAKAIESRRGKYAGNYEGLFGFITNFNWTLNNEGSYDCSIDLTSQGELLQSVEPTKATDGLTEEEIKELNEASTEKQLTYFKNTISVFFKYIHLDKPTKPVNKGKDSFKNRGEAMYAKLAVALKKKETTHEEYPTGEFNTISYRLRIQNNTGFLNAIAARLQGSDDITFITMRTFLALLNAFQMPKDIYGTKDDIAPFSLGFGNKYKTFNDHFSILPTVAVVPKVPKTELYKTFALGTKDNLTHKLASENILGGDDDDILNIYLGSTFLEQEFLALIDNVQDEGVGILDYVKSVLAKVQRALGEINKFTLRYDDVHCQWQVVDEGQPAAALSNKPVPTLQISGLGNTVSNVGVTSTISSQMSSQISIAAQGTGGNTKKDLTAYLQFNRGAVDRHIATKATTEGKTDNKTEKKKTKPLIEKVKEQFEEAHEAGDFFSIAAISLEDFDALSEEIISLHQSNLILDSNGKVDPLPIPIKLELTLKGTSGIKLHRAFKINNDLLPKAYQDYGFLVSSVGHEIGSDSNWNTSIEAQMFKLK